MLLLKLILKHFLLPLICPILGFEVFLRILKLHHPGSFLSWEAASLVQTLIVSAGLMDSDELPFMSKKTLKTVRVTMLLVVVCLLLGKLGLALIELFPEVWKDAPRTQQIAELVLPHWLILPAIAFLASNAVLLRYARKSRREAHIQNESRQESELVGLIFQVDLPVVLPYAFVFVYWLFGSGGHEHSSFIRGMACTLLLVSNFATVGYKYGRLRELRSIGGGRG